ncbi:MAG: dTMP kinase [Planctomycetota bacterium]|nr:dTMP kinase [Planctomycetota bacterium]MEE3053577.1 dTMP kinase [Planctomycetota bacterium]
MPETVPDNSNQEAPGEMAPVFIDFEGIDGSGKTTLSNRISQYLIDNGIPVHHARDKGVFRSEISKAIRNLTRDPRFLRMSDVTEFLLYVARDTQMIDEYIRPKLLPGNLVFCDRYLYSAITHSHHARGLPRDGVDKVLELAARDLWPDLVIYCDVDPLTSRLRKKIQKVRDNKKAGDFGRKGLMGIGFREEMRKGFLELAEEDPEHWLVIDNANSTIEESLQRILNRIRQVLIQKGYPEIPDPCWAELSSEEKPLGEFAEATLEICEGEGEEERRIALTEHFYSELDRLCDGAPGFTALFTAGLDTPESHALRAKVKEREPGMVAKGLGGLRSEEAMDLREELKDTAPVYVAGSLSGMGKNPRACQLRLELADVAPEQIALAVRGSDSEHAWEIRDKIGKKVPDEVLMSLRGLETERAWELRKKRTKDKYARALLQSLGGIDSDEAWELRDRFSNEYLPWVLISLRGLRSDRSWDLRQEHVCRAPKIIIKTIGSSNDPRAWEIRNDSKPYAKEVLDSLSGLDSGDAWRLRMELKDKWPNTAISSLGAGSQSERDWKFRWDMLREHPGNHLLVKHLVKAQLKSVSRRAKEEARKEEGAV